MTKPARGNCFCYQKDEIGNGNIAGGKDQRLHISNTSQHRSLCNQRVIKMAGLHAGDPAIELCNVCARRYATRRELPRKTRAVE